MNLNFVRYGNLEMISGICVAIWVLTCVLCIYMILKKRQIRWAFIEIIILVFTFTFYGACYQVVEDRFINMIEENLKMDCVYSEDLNILNMEDSIQEIYVTDNLRLYPVKFIMRNIDGQDIVIFYTPTSVNGIWKKVESKPIY